MRQDRKARAPVPQAQKSQRQHGTAGALNGGYSSSQLKPAARGAGIVTITGHAYALDAAEGRFTLSVARTGKGGKASSSQSGAFKLDAGEDKPLSTTSINVAPGETLTIELKLLSGGSEVFSATLKTAPQSGSTKI